MKGEREREREREDIASPMSHADPSIPKGMDHTPRSIGVLGKSFGWKIIFNTIGIA